MITNADIKNHEIEDTFLSCPDCGGIGQKTFGFSCSTCGGIGVGTFFHKSFFYWKPRLSKGLIELERLRKKINAIVNIISFGIGVLGLLSILFWVYQTSNNTIRIEDFAFWNYQDKLILFFYLSLLADFFMVYRYSQMNLDGKDVRHYKYNDASVKVGPLNNWQDLKSANSNEKIDISAAMSHEAKYIIEEAFLLAKKLNHKHLTPMHLFFASLDNRDASEVFSRLELDKNVLLEKITNYILKKDISKSSTIISEDTKKVLVNAYIESSKWRLKKVSSKFIISCCLDYEPTISEILYDLDVDKEKIYNVVLWFIVNEKQVSAYKKFRKQARFKPGGTMDKAYTAVATPFLNNFSYDLTREAKWNRLDYCVGREKEIEDVWHNLEGSSNGILLHGHYGVGKKALIAGIAQKMVEEDVPRYFLDKRLIELDVARLVSGVDASQAEGRLLLIIDEINRAGNIVLFIDSIEKIVGITSGGEGSMDLSGVLSNAIGRKNLFVFATVSSENYIKHIEGTALDKEMAVLNIQEPKGNQAIQIIESKISQIESRYVVYFSYNSIEKAVTLTEKYIHDSYLPQKALKILEMAAVKISKMNLDIPLVRAEDIATIVSEITAIPVTKISENESEQLLQLEQKLHERMIGQEEAIKMVSASLRRARTELREGVRPIANFLFLGPSGVGKTELAKTVAEVYFGNEKNMIRIDMSEYQYTDSIKKMIGDSDGTKGVLTERVRRSPFSLILLDEIEKAHPDILNLFLQVMDDGRLSDGQGHLVDFTNNIIIATSNAGAVFIQEQIFKGTAIEGIKTVLINEYLNKIMRPELINRFDGVVVFEPLSMGNVVDVTRLLLKKIEKLVSLKGMELRVEETGLRILAKLGYDPKFGARPLRRLLQEKIEDQIANKILSGELKRRDIIVIDENAEIKIEKAKEL